MKHRTTLDEKDPELLWKAMVAETYSLAEQQLACELYEEYTFAGGGVPDWNSVRGIDQTKWCEVACVAREKLLPKPPT